MMKWCWRLLSTVVLVPSLPLNLKRQVFLGDNRFVTRMQKKSQKRSQDVNVPKVQRRPPAPSLKIIAENYASRNDAIVAAYATGGI
jgi:hypothetical protein